MEDQLKPLIEKALEVAEKTGEFVIDQAPELIQQFYAWHTAMSWLAIGFGSFCVIIALIVHIAGIGKSDYKRTDYYFGSGLSAAIGLIPLIVGVIKLVKITLTPKLYLIEYFLR